MIRLKCQDLKREEAGIENHGQGEKEVESTSAIHRLVLLNETNIPEKGLDISPELCYIVAQPRSWGS